MKKTKYTLKEIINSSKITKFLFVILIISIVIFTVNLIFIGLHYAVNENIIFGRFQAEIFLLSYDGMSVAYPKLSPNKEHLLSLSWGDDMGNDFLTFRIINNETREVEYVWDEYMHLGSSSSIKWEEDNSVYVRDSFCHDAEYIVTYDGREWIGSGWIPEE